MELVIRIPIDREKTEGMFGSLDAGKIGEAAQELLRDGPVPSASRNILLDTLEEVIGEGLATLGIYGSESESLLVDVEEG